MQNTNVSGVTDGVQEAVENTLHEAGEKIAADMRSNLTAAGHIDTGRLLNSIRSETTSSPGHVVMRVFADAEAEDGALYWDFIENGTGAAHGRAGGRVGKWRYKDRSGNWHTTDGMDADPFAEPAIDPVVDDISGKIVSAINKAIGKSASKVSMTRNF